MKKLLPSILKHAVSDRQQRFRDRRGHYASSALKDLRDQYWDWTKEPKTNPADFIGKVKMMIGTAVGKQVVTEWFSDLHWYGLPMFGSEVPVGGSNPAWDGSLDVLMGEKLEGGKYKRFVVEVKTKSGYGADLLMQNFEISEDYLAQLGLYLKDMHNKGVTSEGMLFYVLLSDSNFGNVLIAYCRYSPETDEIVAYEAETSTGETRSLGQKLKIGTIEERYRAIDKAVAEKKPPAGEYPYKYALTAEFVEGVSDNQLRKAIRGEAVLGPWQPKYSAYKNKNLALDGVEPGYSEAELATLRAEYKKRHPKSKI